MRRSSGLSCRTPRSPPRAAAGIRSGSPSLPRSKTTTNSRNILLVSYYRRAVRGKHQDQTRAACQLPGVTGREQAMVLIGLTIIAVVLMALMVPGVSGIQWKLPVPMPATDNPDKARTGSPRRSSGNTVRLTHPNLVHARNASNQYGHLGSSSTATVKRELRGQDALAFWCSPPSDTSKPHERPFTGMLGRHPRSASGRSGCFFPFFSLSSHPSPNSAVSGLCRW
jgi:hypothetical protein